MKNLRRIILLVMLMSTTCSMVFAQATDLIIDNQSPGWLSSKIGYGDQQTVENLKVIGYINAEDLQFIAQLIKNHSLHGRLDLENANIVSTTGGKNNYLYVDNKGLGSGSLSSETHPLHLQYFSMPQTIVGGDQSALNQLNIDTLFINTTTTQSAVQAFLANVKHLKIGDRIAKLRYPALKEFAPYPNGAIESIEFPSSLKEIREYRSSSLSISGIRLKIKNGKNLKEFPSLERLFTNISVEEMPDSVYFPNIKVLSLNQYLDYKADRMFKEGMHVFIGEKIDTLTEMSNAFGIHLHFASPTPPVMEGSAAYHYQLDNRSEFILHVPKGSANAYRNCFKDGGSKVTIIEESVEITTIELNQHVLELTTGDFYNLSTNILPDNASDKSLEWTSSDNSIVEVDQEGKIKAKAGGKVVITVTSKSNPDVKDQCEVTVIQPVTSIKLSESAITLNKLSGTKQLTAQILPADATDKSLTWTSSNIDVAEVDANGLVIAKKAGKATITATAVSNSEAKDECEVTVLQPVTGITLSENKVTMTELGEMKQLVATVLPEDASNKAVTWTSSDPSVCSVTKNGTLVAMGYGTATIMATTIDGGFPAVCVIQVTSYVVGDINGDDKVDVSDYTGIANFIHGNPPAGFNEKAADVDKNGTVDVSDYTGIANIIHTGSIYGNSSNSARATGNQPTADWDAKDNVIFIAPFTATAGTKTAISFEMKNTAAIRGFQFDLYLPEGMTVVKSAKGKIQGKLSEGRLPDEDEHDLTFSQQPDGAIRFLCSSLYDETFTGTSGELATLQVEIASDMANGEYTIQLKNMKLTETDISKYYTSDLIESTVTIGGESSGIIVINNEQLTNDNEAGVYYTIDGKRLTSKPAKSGLYIKNGKKVVIK